MSYITTQEYNYYAHIEEYFRSAIVSQLDYQSLIIFREHLLDKELSNNTVNKLMILLKKIIDVAVRYQILKENPCRLIKKLPINRIEMSYWSIEEFLIFDNSIRDNEFIFKLFFELAFYTGMRKGEILALTWQDIKFRRGTIDVNKSVTKINGQEYISSTKTKAGMRQIAINNKLLKTLNDWREEHMSMFKGYSDTPIDETRVFEISFGRVLDSGSIRKKFEQLLKRNPNLDPIRIHDLRHSHVAMLINFGTEPFLIKERLGHASIRTTYDVYGHLYPNKQKSVADQIDLLTK